MANLFDPSSIYTALAQRGLLPSWAGENKGGTPSFFAETNRMFVPQDEPRSVAHEMTHGAQHSLLLSTAKQIADKGSKATDQEKQFLTAVNKLMAETYGMPTGSYRDISDVYNKTVEALFGKKRKDFNEFDRYRTSPREAQAFGVGNMSRPEENPFEKNRPHLDPSYATEFDILLSMYNNLPEEIKAQSAERRKADIEFGRKWYKEDEQKDKQRYNFVDVFANPFKSTIK